MKLPNRKITNYVEQETGGELLIYNLSTNRAFCLNETSAIVFSNCDGRTTLVELKRASAFSDELIFLALDELKRQDLIEDDFASPFAATSRREVVRRVGLASMIALPVISAIVAPRSAQAASLRAACQTCSNNSQCASSRYSENLVAPFGNLCSSGTSGFTFPAGFVGRGPFSEPDCAQFGAQSCCSGGATRNASADCVCNS